MKMLTAAAVALMLATPAIAQQSEGKSPSTGNMPSSQQGGNQGQSPMAPSNTAQQSMSGQAAGATADANRFRANQGQDQWLVSNLWNKNVNNAAGQSIGELNDILVDKDGKISAIVVGVGGFLGLGQKNVAVDFHQFQQGGSISADRIVLGMSEQDLRNAPTFQSRSSSDNR